MTTLRQPADRRPDWQVTTVFDPDGEGHDFAYTVGLDDRGLPELHIWGRPSLGDDPGADWMFSPHDRCRILNELGWRLVDGRLAVGDSWEEEYDDGMVTVRFRIDPPGDRDELEAFGIAPTASVLPVRWSLHRRPIRPPRPLAKRALQRAKSEYAALLAGLPDDAELPPGWSLPPEFVPGGELGPLTPMAAGRVADLWNADSVELIKLAWAANAVEAGGHLTWPATVASAVARDLGRVEEAARATKAAEEVVAARVARPDWPATLTDVRAGVGLDPGEGSDERFEHGLRHLLTDMLWTVLCTEVVADGLTATQRVRGRGAWLSGLAPAGDLPGSQWRAPRPVLDRLVELLGPLGFNELVLIVLREESGVFADYQELSHRIQGWAMVSAAGCPWRGVLDRLPGVQGVGRMTALQEWATVMTSAVCHRDRLTSAEVATLCAPFLDVLPELPALFST